MDLGDLDSGSNWETLASESANGSIGNMSPSRQRHALWLALRGTPKVFQESLEGHRKNCVGQYRLINNSDWRRKGRCYRSLMAAHSKTSAFNTHLGSVTLLQYVQPTEQIPGPDILSGINYLSLLG